MIGRRRRWSTPGRIRSTGCCSARCTSVLDGMDVDDRVAFVLHCIEGETLDAVAGICRCSLATAKRRIARAQQAIDRLVGDDGGEVGP